jgi:hypothetical protein
MRADPEIAGVIPMVSEGDMFAASCRSGQENGLSVGNGNAAVAIVYPALRSIDENDRRDT